MYICIYVYLWCTVQANSVKRIFLKKAKKSDLAILKKAKKKRFKKKNKKKQKKKKQKKSKQKSKKKAKKKQ